MKKKNIDQKTPTTTTKKLLIILPLKEITSTI